MIKQLLLKGISVVLILNLVSFSLYAGMGGGSTSGGNLSSDPDPTLSGDLKTNGHKIISESNQNIEIQPDGTGKIKLNGTTNINDAYEFPIIDGTSGQILKTDGNGILTWEDDTGGAGSSTFQELTDTSIINATQAQISIYDADDSKWENKTFSGDITINKEGVTSIGVDKITESMIDCLNAATNNYTLSYNNTSSKFEWKAVNDLINAGSNLTWDSSTLNSDSDLHNYSWSNVDGTDLKVGSITQEYDEDLDDLSDGTLSKSKVEDSSNWDTAYSWGDHSIQNYLDLDTYPNVDTDSTDDFSGSYNDLSDKPINIDEDSTDDLISSDLDSESELETQLSDVTNVFTNNDGSLSDDDLSNNTIQDLNNIAITNLIDKQILIYSSTTENFENSNISDLITAGDNLSWNLNTLNVENNFLLNTGDSGTGDYNFGDATTFEIPNNTDPVLNSDGQIAFDNNVITQGTIVSILNAEKLYSVMTRDLPNDNEIPKYNSATGTITWESDAQGGATAGGWTDEGDYTHTETINDNVIIGGTILPSGTPQATLSLIQNQVPTKAPEDGVTLYAKGIDNQCDHTYQAMLHFNGTDGDTTTTDTSYQNHIITFNGTSEIDDASPKFGTTSLWLDGNSDYVSVNERANSDDWDIVRNISETWSIDFWAKHDGVYPNTGLVGQYIDSNNYWTFATDYSNGRLQFRVRSGGSTIVDLYASGGHQNNYDWHHYVVFRNGSTYGVYRDGVQYGYVSDSSTADFSGDLLIGHAVDIYGNYDYYPGWIDEFRIAKSNVLGLSPNSGKTDTYTIPSSEYVENEIVYPKLKMKDEHGNEFTFYEDESITENLFDATDDANDEDILTWESSTRQFEWHTPSELITAGNSLTWDGTTLNCNVGWDGSGNTFYSQDNDNNYIIGNSQAPSGKPLNTFSITQTGNATLPSKSPKDSITFFTQGDPGRPSSNCKLMLRFNGDDESTSIVDNSYYNHSITTVGNAQIDTTQAKFGKGCYKGEGSGDGMYTPDSSDWDIYSSNTSNWTIDGWVRYNSSHGPTYFQHYQDSDNYWYIDDNSANGRMDFILRSGGVTTMNYIAPGGRPFSTNTWYHWAFVKKGTTYGWYLNGTQYGYFQDSDIADFTGNLYIASNYNNTQNLNGYMDEVRVVNYDIFTANPNSGKTDTITIPSLENINPTPSTCKLMLHANGLDDSTTIIDDSDSNHNFTAVNSAHIDTTVKKFGNGSFQFNGNNDKVSCPASSDFNVFKSKEEYWTIDGWVRYNINFQSPTWIRCYQDSSNYWYIADNYANGRLDFYVISGGSTAISMIASGARPPALNTWYHFAIVKNGSTYGFYFNGQQYGYTSDTSVADILGSLHIGAKQDNTGCLDGYLDEIRISNKNVLSAYPNSGNTNTFTIPSTEYSDPEYENVQIKTIDPEGNVGIIPGENNSVTEAMLNTINSAVDLYHLSWDNSNSKFKWVESFSGSYNDLSDIPVNIDIDSTDDLVDDDFSSPGLMKTDGAGTYSIITDNSSNWNTAYSWEDHSTQNYLDMDTYPNVDTDSTDDFSGSYNDLSDKPTNIDEDSTDDLTTSNLDSETELESLLTDVTNIYTNNDDLFLLNTGDTGTGNYDFGSATLEIPNSTDSTLTVDGQLAFDTDVITQGMLQGYINAQKIYMVGTDNLPSDNQVPTYDSASGTIQWEDASSGDVDPLTLTSRSTPSNPTDGVKLYSQNDTSILLNFNGTNLSTSIDDESQYNHSITNNGCVLHTGWKQFGTASCNFDGTNDYLYIAPHNSVNIFADNEADWTIDLWVMHDREPAANDKYCGQDTDGSNYWQFLYQGGLRFDYVVSSTTQIDMTGGTIPNDHLWHHVAFVSKGGVVGIYLDGNQVDYDTWSAEHTYVENFQIGMMQSNYFDGHMDDFRITKRDIFNANPVSDNSDTITIPTSEATPDIDSSYLKYINSNGDEYTLNNIPEASGYEKLNTGNRIKMDTIGTIEEDPSDPIVINQQPQPSNPSNGIKLYSRGSTSLLLNFNGVNLGTDFYDSSPWNHTLTVYGTPVTHTGYAKFGTASVDLDGSTDYFLIPDSPAFDIFADLDSDWTIDVWTKHDRQPATYDSIINQMEDTSNLWEFQVTSIGVRMQATSGGSSILSMTPSSQINDNDWHHLAFIKVKDKCALYKDGNQIAYDILDSAKDYSSVVQVGLQYGGSYFNGHMDDLRVVKKNIFDANPDSGLTDTITMPTSEAELEEDSKPYYLDGSGNEFSLQKYYDAPVSEANNRIKLNYNTDQFEVNNNNELSLIKSGSIAEDTDLDTDEILNTGLSKGYGLLIVRNSTDQITGVYRIDYHSLTSVSADTNFSTTKDTASKYNIYWETDQFKLQNKVGDNKNIKVGYFGV